MEENTRISDLIVQELLGNISEEDKSVLSDWRASSNDNEKLYHRIVDQKRIEASFHTYSEVDIAKAYKRITERKGMLRKIAPVWYRYAAVVTLLIAVSGMLFYMNKPLTSQKSPILLPPGEFKAHLITSEGVDYNLDDPELIEIIGEETSIANKEDGLQYNQKKEDETNEETKTEINYHTLIVPRGGEYKLVLADGTKVWLNAETSLTYPEVFTGAKREVVLNGEAFFEVSHSADQPFIVVASEMNVEVLGTQFNVKGYTNESDLTATLISGKVNVSNYYNRTQQVILNPGEQANLDRESLDVKVKKVDPFGIAAWRSGRFMFRGEKLGDITKALSRWYNVTINYEDPALQDLVFNVNTSRYSNISEMLNAIEKTEIVQFVQPDQSTILVKKKI